MATLSFTVARPFDIAGTRRRTIGQISGPASYVTGGDSFLAGEVQIGTLEHVIFEVATDGTNFRLLLYDHDNETVVWVVPDTGAQVAADVDLSSFNARFEAVGN